MIERIRHKSLEELDELMVDFAREASGEAAAAEAEAEAEAEAGAGDGEHIQAQDSPPRRLRRNIRDFFVPSTSQDDSGASRGAMDGSVLGSGSLYTPSHCS
jgi:hypothetical protein